jgi:hypothetical protein
VRRCAHHANAEYLGADEPVAIPAGLSEEVRAVFARAPSVGDRRVADALGVGRNSQNQKKIDEPLHA